MGICGARPQCFGLCLGRQHRDRECQLRGLRQPMGQTNGSGRFICPNAFGLYDMHGNVWEWCEDNWHNDYTGNPPADGSVCAAMTLVASCAAVSWVNDPQFLRSANRFRLLPVARDNYVGFRVARTL